MNSEEITRQIIGTFKSTNTDGNTLIHFDFMEALDVTHKHATYVVLLLLNV
jgi:hypothetical protein